MEQYGVFIGGHERPVDDGGTIDVVDPSDGTARGTIAVAGPHDVAAAVGAAADAFAGPWGATPPTGRAEALRSIAGALRSNGTAVIEAEVHDAGQCRATPLTRVAASWLERYAAEAERIPDAEELPPAIPGVTSNVLLRRPVGVCAQLIPFNAPLLMAVLKIGPALAAGNTVVLKPSEAASTPVLELARLIERHTDLPAGVVNVVTGDAETGRALVDDPRVGMIAFTGSTAVGEQVMRSAASGARKVLLELGGKSAHVVLPDVDPGDAARAAAFAAFLHQGQACIAGTRLLVHESRAADVLDALAAEVGHLRIGAAWDPATQVGPMINVRQRYRALAFVEGAREDGATVVAGGDIPDLGPELAGGAYLRPAVVAGVEPHHRLHCDEVFGPVLAVSTYTTVDEAVALANDTEFGLAAGVTGVDVDEAEAVARRLVAGTVWVNSWHHLHREAPFGGLKASGVGREMGRWAVEEYTELIHLHVHRDATRQNPLLVDWFADR